jgi:hypothetical protein
MTSVRLISTDDIAPNRASGYVLVNKELKNEPWVTPSFASTACGSLYLDVFDMAKWDAALYTERLIRRSSLEEMWTPVKLNDGSTYPCGFAWRVRQVNGHQLRQHDGAETAFTTRFVRYVDDGISIVVLRNLGEDEEALMPTLPQLREDLLRVHGQENTRATRQHVAFFVKDLRYSVPSPSLHPDFARIHAQGFLQRYGPKIVHRHLRSHRRHPVQLIQLCHNFIQQRSNDSAMTVSRRSGVALTQSKATLHPPFRFVEAEFQLHAVRIVLAAGEAVVFPRGNMATVSLCEALGHKPEFYVTP